MLRGNPLDGATAVNMGVTEKWRSAAVTHPGRLRAENQDRGYVDDSLGIFLVSMDWAATRRAKRPPRLPWK